MIFLTSTMPAYRDTLKAFYISMAKLAPRQQAPRFTLKDDGGNALPPTDLKGKVAFIDFWRVIFGPYIGDIKGNGAKFHEKYKDKPVVFRNICVNVVTKEWKKAIKDLKLEGKNLLAEGWTKNLKLLNYRS